MANNELPNEEVAGASDTEREKSTRSAKMVADSVGNYFRNVKKMRWVILGGVTLLGVAGGVMLSLTEDKSRLPEARTPNVSGPSYSVLEQTTPYQEELLRQSDENRQRRQKEEGGSFIPLAMGVPQQEQDAAPAQTNTTDPAALAESITQDLEELGSRVKDPAEPTPSATETVTTTDGNDGNEITISEDDIKRIGALFKSWERQTSRKPEYTVIEYELSDKTTETAEQTNDGSTTRANDVNENRNTLIDAGTVAYASLTFTYDSDLKNLPVVSQVHGGPLDGAQLIGNVEPVRTEAVFRYTTIIVDGRSYATEAYAVGNECDCLALEAEYDPRIIQTVLIPAAADFLVGFGLPSLAGGTTVTVDGGTVIEERENNRDARILSGVSNAASRAYDQYSKVLPTEGETKIYSGVPHAVFFAREVVAQ